METKPLRWSALKRSFSSAGWLSRVLIAGGAVLAIVVVSYISSPRERLPRPAVFSSTESLNIDTCAECHADLCEGFSQSPHFQTLHSAQHPDVKRNFLSRPASGKLADEEADRAAEIFERDGKLWMQAANYPQPLPIDWVFGSGRHAQTPVSVVENPQGKTELIELSLSWYPGHGLGRTIVADPEKTSLAFHPRKLSDASAGPGNWHSVGESRRCFGCHSTSAPTTDGRIEFQRLLPGVRCQRCHPGGRQHAAAALASEDDLQIKRWADLSPQESIRRCGECHRRADELSPEEIKADRRHLVRFAPVGLSQSACFQQQKTLGKRLTCTTCHDPHRPAETDQEFYRQRCLTCHGVSSDQAVGCTAQPQTAACLSCHMPKVAVSKHLSFTDHWIRVRTRTDKPKR